MPVTGLAIIVSLIDDSRVMENNNKVPALGTASADQCRMNSVSELSGCEDG